MDQPRAELARLCRQILVQSETATPRTSLSEEDFTRALAQVQEQFGGETINEDTLWEVVSQEEKRVSDAAALAEILLPKLSAVMRTRSSSAAPIVSPAAMPVPQSAPKTEAPAMARNGPLGVADLIQGMLDQDRSDSRPRSPAR